MYKIFRRISSSFFPRPDRPWSEDATSNAPQIGRKRRLSSTEPDADLALPSVKKRRAESGDTDTAENAAEREESPTRPGKETEEVKEVTKGVKEVELDEGKQKAPESATAEEAAAIPLPDSPTLQAAEAAQEVDAEAPAVEKVALEEEGTSPSTELTTENVGEIEEKAADAEYDQEDEIPGLTAGAGAAKQLPPTDPSPAEATDMSAKPDEAAHNTTKEQPVNGP